MKVAVIIAHVASGWKVLVTGEDIAAIKQDFKYLKIAGSHAVGEEAADVAVYLDTAGNVRRKKLNSPGEATAVASANRKVAADVAAAEEKRVAETAAAEGRTQARKIAEKAVAVVTEEISKVAAEPVAAPAEAATPEPDSGDSGNPDERFGKPKPTRKR